MLNLVALCVMGAFAWGLREVMGYSPDFSAGTAFGMVLMFALVVGAFKVAPDRFTGR